MKRFWKNTEVLAAGENYIVKLDTRPVKLPSGKPLTIPFLPLAEAIANEWGNVPQDFSPDDLPLTRLTSTAQERIAPHRDDIVNQLAAYGMNDLLCYRAEAPDDLVTRQNETWDPWLRWAEATYGLCFLSTAGLIPINQPSSTGDTLRATLSSQSDYTIAALGVIVPALGSLVLGLALTAEALDPRAACNIAVLDELWQEEQWGTEDEAIIRRARVITDVAVSARFIHLAAL